MKAIKLSVPIFFILFSSVFLIASINLPKASLGNPNAPMYFPAGLSIIMLIFSIIYLFQELKKLDKENKYIKQMLSGRTPKLIGFTILLGVIYAFVFDRIGFLYSTILYLGGLLFYINGIKKWLVNIIVTIAFSFLSWYAFSVLLGVSLP